MADLHVHRNHPLGLEGARRLIDAWIADGESRFGLQCALTRTPEGDVVTFSRTGVSGTLRASACELELSARLGFLLRPYAQRIAAEIQRQLDQSIGTAP
ncbi:polyhydroxyalkanoic acid system family protein [Tepidicella baoligensis]|uniref:polyhydroxyalkanoic acid system family protein n=1 Tax=Tepidicella baoligensis TaxID=2707016 RepID=UPI0015DA5281|nr:polyhydroxyalkanoic acid system family protein [Tepidicella baoligensis]